jgi:hypothetical protein
MRRFLFTLFSALAMGAVAAQSPAPTPGLDPAKEFKVRVDGRELFVHDAPVAAFAGFDLLTAVNVEIESAPAIQKVYIRPKALGIRPEIIGNKIGFRLESPAQLSIEINGDIKRPLLLFADPPEKDAPKPGAPGVKFFAAGKVHEAGRIEIKSGETVYIERGALVRGSLFMDEVKNVKILGRGILDGGLFKPAQSRMVEIDRAEDVLVEGITITDSKHWTVPILRSDRVKIRNVKIISGNNWDDGVDVVGSRDVTIEKCFIRTKDDCVAIKAGVTYFTKFDCQRDVENVVVRDCVLWNAEWGNGLEIGFETRAANIRKVRFINNDLIHVEGPEGTFTIHNGDRATVSDVTYDNIRVEDSVGILVDFKILKSRYSRDAERGHIRNILFRNISVEGTMIPPSLLLGFDAEHQVENVVFENFQVRGKKWTRLEDGQFKTEFATGMKFR